MVSFSLPKTLLQTSKFRAYQKQARVIICATPPKKGTSSGKPPQTNQGPSPMGVSMTDMMFLHKPKNIKKEIKKTNKGEDDDHGNPAAEKTHQAAAAAAD
ncbi:hypothetical protein CRYUN_Cryun26dG0109100 [Craigia yunnanensis]